MVRHIPECWTKPGIYDLYMMDLRLDKFITNTKSHTVITFRRLWNTHFPDVSIPVNGR
jgi:hypothetical protein